MGEKKKSGLVLVIIILILIILGLGAYVVYDKLIVEQKTTKESSNKNVKKSVEGKESIISLDMNNESIKALFTNSHNDTLYLIDDKVFNNTSLNVEDMDEEYKVQVASSLFRNKVEKYSNQQFISEDDVKSGYERMFGPNTFKRTLSTMDLGCGDYTYNTQTKKYEKALAECGGTSGFYNIEDIISATKYNDKIEIVSAVVFVSLEDDALFKDYKRQEKIKDLAVEKNTVDDPASEKYKKYIQNNKDNLQQYTYTYQLNNDGFYYYTGVKRTKS